MTISLPRITSLLGVTVERIDEAALQAAIASRIPEDVDLDWKSSLYPASDSGNKELAKDVAAMANSQGGLIVLGVQDDSQGCAKQLIDLVLADAEALRMRQVIASATAPMVPAVEIRLVESAADNARGYYCLAIPRSTLAPHAVIMNSRPQLSYPARNGTSTIWLSEWQIAERYRNRFTIARDQIAHLDALMAEGESHPSLAPHTGWLCMALLPELPAVGRPLMNIGM